MNKKGVSYELILWMGRFALVGLIMVSLFWVIGLFTSIKADTSALEADIILNRLFSKEGISYNDKFTGRTYPYAVDLNKFSEEQLNKTFTDNYNRFALSLLLSNNETGESKEVFFNKFLYEIGKPLDWSNKYHSEIINNYVLIKDGDKIWRGFLRVIVLVPEEGGLNTEGSNNEE